MAAADLLEPCKTMPTKALSSVAVMPRHECCIRQKEVHEKARDSLEWKIGQKSACAIAAPFAPHGTSNAMGYKDHGEAWLHEEHLTYACT